MSVEVIFQLNAYLSVARLVTEERVLQQLVRVRPLCVVFEQAHVNEVDKLLGPSRTHVSK